MGEGEGGQGGCSRPLALLNGTEPGGGRAHVAIRSSGTVGVCLESREMGEGTVGRRERR